MQVVVVGLGWAARSIWLPGLLRQPGFRVVGVDPHAARRAAVERDFPGVVTVPALAGVPEGPDGFAVVATPNHLHASIAADLLGRGIPVVVEKPVCLTQDEVDRLASLESAGAVVVACAPARFRTDVQHLWELLRSGRLGDPRLVELEWVRASGIPSRTSWFTSVATAGGGAMLDLGWHLLDLGFAMIGPRRIEHASCVLGYDFIDGGGAEADWRGDEGAARGHEVDVEDSAAAWLALEGGIGVQMRAAWASPEPLDVTRVSITGSEGAATLRTTFGFSPRRVERPTLNVRNGSRVEEVDLPHAAIGAEYEAFVDDVVSRVADGNVASALPEVRLLVEAMDRLYAGSVAPQRPVASLRD